GSKGYCCSPRVRKTSLLVTMTLNPGHDSSNSITYGPALVTCSKLSSSSNSCLSLRCSIRPGNACPYSVSCNPSALLTVSSTMLLSVSEANGMKNTPSAKGEVVATLRLASSPSISLPTCKHS